MRFAAGHRAARRGAGQVIGGVPIGGSLTDVAVNLPKTRQGPRADSPRVDRGGGWHHSMGQALSANQGHAPPDNRVTDKGFRVVREIGERL